MNRARLSDARPHGRAETGQAIVVMALALVAIILGAALVLEAGNAFAQQRMAQNGADAAANAGAVVMAERLGGATHTNADVYSAVTAAAAANGLSNPQPVYTTINGSNTAGGPVAVANDSGTPPSDAAGVRVGGNRDFATYLARVAGISQLHASADATAVAGLLTGVCAATSGCGVVPVTFPVLISTCDFPHTTVSIGTGPYTAVSIDQRTAANESIVPLCTSGPGSIGWLDLGSGNLDQQVTTPTNKAFNLPVWLQTKTGNSNAVDLAMNSYDGKVILVPMFDGTCKVPPGGLTLSDCPASQAGTASGNNTWYHVPKFTGFYLDHAYIQGGAQNTAACQSAPGQPLMGGNGSMTCLKGWFIRFITQGPVVAGDGSDTSSAIGVQLVK